MRIVHLSRFDGGDGAANVAQRVHRGLLRLGHDSTMFVAQRRSESADPTVVLFRPPTDLPSRERRRLRDMQLNRSFAPYRDSRPAGYEAFSDDRSRHGPELLDQLPACDVLHIQQMFQFVDYQSFFTVFPQHTPVVRTLHDVSFFAGGCHSPEGCDKYTEQCGACPQLGSQDPEDLSRQIWRRKSAVFQGILPGRLYIVSPSRWLMNEAKRSSLLKDFPGVLIPHGVDTEVFRPRDRNLARDKLAIPQDALVVLFVAEPIDRPIKNFALLAQALEGLGDLPNLLLVSAGSGRPPVEVRVPYLNLGSLRNEHLLSLVYSAADIFVLPSRQENFPLTILEAMACGTPVVGAAVGGVPEMVRPGVTGVLFAPQNVTALRAAIADLLQDPRRRGEMAANCRRIAVEEYSLELQLKRHVELYQTILAGRPCVARKQRPMIPENVKRRWTEFWMRYAGLSRFGRIATRFAVVFAPPYQARKYLKYLNPQGYISPEAILYHPQLRLGAHVFIGDRVMMIQAEGGGPIEIGDEANLWGDSQLETGRGGTITIGAGTRVNRGVHVISYVAPIRIGRDVGLSTNCLLHSFNHGTAPGQPYIDQPLVTKGPIIIDDHAWIGMGSIVLSGVHIGKHAVVGAGSVVTHDVPEGAVAMGVPARVVRMRSEFHEEKIVEYESWLKRLSITSQELGALIPPGDSFILVDENQFGFEVVAGRRSIPFLERDGQYWGRPPDAVTAIRECERLRRSGANFIAFGWPAFWWLDCYQELNRHLRSSFRCVLHNDRLVVFDLRP